MGLDNGFICKNIKRDEIPSYVRLPWDCRDEDVEIAYFRKCWGIRGEIIRLLHVEDDEYKILVEKEDIIPIVKILMKYLDREYYDENADSIWEYDEYKENTQHSIINLMWLRVYMETHPDVTCYFYDSY